MSTASLDQAVERLGYVAQMVEALRDGEFSIDTLGEQLQDELEAAIGCVRQAKEAAWQ